MTVTVSNPVARGLVTNTNCPQYSNVVVRLSIEEKPPPALHWFAVVVGRLVPGAWEALPKVSVISFPWLYLPCL